MLTDEVETVEPLFKAQNGTVHWWKVKLKGREARFACHQNFFALYGDLNLGDKVQYEVSKAKLSKGGVQGVDVKEGYLLFNLLRKVEVKSVMEEMTSLVQKGTES